MATPHSQNLTQIMPPLLYLCCSESLLVRTILHHIQPGPSLGTFTCSYPWERSSAAKDSCTAAEMPTNYAGSGASDLCKASSAFILARPRYLSLVLTTVLQRLAFTSDADECCAADVLTAATCSCGCLTFSLEPLLLLISSPMYHVSQPYLCQSQSSMYPALILPQRS